MKQFYVNTTDALTVFCPSMIQGLIPDTFSLLMFLSPSACACVCVCVSVCVCVLISFHCKRLLTQQNNKCNSRVQIGDCIMWKYFCVTGLCLRVKDHRKSVHRKSVQSSNCAKECQLNRAKPREVKCNS